MKVDIKDMPELRVATVAHVGSYSSIDRAFAKLSEVAEAEGLFGAPGSKMLAIYYDDPETTPEAQLRSDAGITVSEDATIPERLAEARIPAGRYACMRCVGPYEQLPAAWMQLMGEWLPASGHEAGAGASYELYLNTPMDTPPEMLVTELYVSVV